MADEIQQKILQILYDGRHDHFQALEDEDLAELLGKPWHAVRAEVASLEEKKLIAVKSRYDDERMYHFYTITPEGIKYYEHPPLMEITVFISSPGDVEKERDAAKRAIQRLNELPFISGRYVLKALRYEDLVPAEIGERPQPTVNRYMREAGNADIFICILWQRMGMPVLDEATGQLYQSGTEYEFLSAYRSREERGTPYMLLYRGMKRPPAERDQDQAERVNAFFQKFMGPEAEFKGVYGAFRTTKDFEKMVYDHVAILIKEYFLSQNPARSQDR